MTIPCLESILFQSRVKSLEQLGVSLTRDAEQFKRGIFKYENLGRKVDVSALAVVLLLSLL